MNPVEKNMTAVLDNYRDDPVRFVEEVLGHPPPYEKQREILRTVAEERRTSVVGANGSGKDWAAARTMLWWLATRRRAIAVATGPTQRQVDQIVWRELRAAHKASGVDLGGRLSGSQWNIADDRYAIGFSTNKADNLQGFHSPELLVVVTEAHAMPQDQMEALKRLYPARMLLTGNAFSRDGEFFESHHTKRHIYSGVTISVYDTPNFTGENGGAPGMPTEEDVEERKLDWGEDHPLYQGSILARFPDMLDDSLLSRSAIEAAVTRWEEQPSPTHFSALPLPQGEGKENPTPNYPPHPLAEGAPAPPIPIPRPLGEGNAARREGEGVPPGEGPPAPESALFAPALTHALQCAPSPPGEGGQTGAPPDPTPLPQGEGNAPWREGEGRPLPPNSSPRPLGEGNAACREGEGRPLPPNSSPRPLGEGNARQREGEGRPLPPNSSPRPLGEGNAACREGEGCRLGVDVARFGSDKTALCVRRGWRVESLRSFTRIDTMRTAGEAAALVRDHDIPAVFVDEGGLGAGVVDRLRELGAPVHGVQFGGKARQSGRFANMRAELFWELRRLFNDNLIAIPRDEELISQLLGLRYDVTSAGQVKMESKSSLRKRGLRSPDKADALALAFMEPPSLQIWTGPPNAPPRDPGPVRDSTSWSTFPDMSPNFTIR